MFKPALARGEIQCIGATTLDEYRQYIEKDGVERRFQVMNPTIHKHQPPMNTISISSNVMQQDRSPDATTDHH
jgi:ATP-dependent Clp protease ATP-binding subunit ClpA